MQCYHMWLFYYLYCADFKFIKAVFKLKFEFAKVLFARDFDILLGKSKRSRRRVDQAWQILR